MISHDRTKDEGSVLLLILGLVVLAALFVTVVIDVSALFLDRRELISAADAAALAGAQGIDEGSVYRDGLPESGALTLNRDRAEALAQNYLVDQGIVGSFDDLDVDVEVTNTTVTVHLMARVRLPIANVVTPAAGQGVTVEAQATAHSAVIP